MASRDSRGLTAAAGLAGAAVAIGVATHRGAGRALDERIYKLVNSGLQRPALDRAFGAVTELGSFWASLAAGAVIAATGHRLAAARAVGAAGVTWALGQGLKRVFRRPRPYETRAPGRRLIGKPHGMSFPSSHPAVLVTFLSVASRELGVPRWARGALGGLAASVAASRVYLGVHYPADVAGGVLVGEAVARAWPSTAEVG